MTPGKRKQAKTQSGGRKAQKTQQTKDNNTPVDETFDAADVTVFVDDDGVIYDASLNQTNIGDNNNKFYFLQLLKAIDGKTYYTHTRWGRVGELGQSKTMGPESFEEALKDFEKKFKDKSGLEWESRYDETISKAKKYTFIEKSYESEDDIDADDDDNNRGEYVKSKLPMPTQRLIELIFNENHFNSVLEEIGYNSDKTPLGKLGPTTLKTGFEYLQELASLIKHRSLAQNKYSKSQKEMIEDFSNKYYSTIPHLFGRARAPMIDNNDLLRKEVAMLDTLTDMEVANSIMNANDKAKDSGSVSLLDKRFQDLKLKEMVPLDHKSTEYKELAEYLIHSSSTGHGLKYRLEDIFRIERPGELERFQKSKFAKIKDTNRLLLWHGSRTPNYSGILSQGLRIAPPEAPLNGYAFGKGIYLADISSKSANYCMSSMSGGIGLLLLCEAECSNPMYEIPTGDSEAEEKCKKNNCIVTKGIGKTVPLKWKDAGVVHDSLKGVLMPDGKPGDNKHHKGGFLQYNEYIVYNIEQIRLRYLFKVTM